MYQMNTAQFNQMAEVTIHPDGSISINHSGIEVVPHRITPSLATSCIKARRQKLYCRAQSVPLFYSHTTSR